MTRQVVPVCGCTRGRRTSLRRVPRVLMVVEPAEGGTAEVVAALAAHLPGHGYEVEIAGPLEAPRYPGAHRLPLRPGLRLAAR